MVWFNEMNFAQRIKNSLCIGRIKWMIIKRKSNMCSSEVLRKIAFFCNLKLKAECKKA